MGNFEIYSEPKKFYKKMLEDIMSSKKHVYLECHLYWDDFIGKKFRRVLTKRAAEGVKVKLLIDAWGAKIDKKKYFKKLIKNGGEVRYFREIKYVLRFLSKNHERNHRKLLLIDDKISYIGSANISSEFYPDGRELVMRIDGNITTAFAKTFLNSWDSAGGLNKKRIKSLFHRGFEIIQDAPSEIYKATERRYIKLIDGARKEIFIESPYFIPSRGVRKAFVRAIKRNVKIKLVLPHYSDMKIADIVRGRYLGEAHRSGVEIYYYPRHKLHSKLLIIDDKFFLLGSSNLDYRSFLHQFEINLLGKNKRMIHALKKSYCQALRKCIPFDYNEWKQRSSIDKSLDLLFLLIRKYI